MRSNTWRGRLPGRALAGRFLEGLRLSYAKIPPDKVGMRAFRARMERPSERELIRSSREYGRALAGGIFVLDSLSPGSMRPARARPGSLPNDSTYISRDFPPQPHSTQVREKTCHPETPHYHTLLFLTTHPRKPSPPLSGKSPAHLQPFPACEYH